jgi:hypothetical protein
VLPFSCNSVWSASPPARWGNSVLNAALCSMRSATGSMTCPTFGSWLFVPPPHSQPLCFSLPLLDFSGSSGSPAPTLRHCASPYLCWVLATALGGWFVFALLLLAFVALPAFIHWEFSTESSAPCPTSILWDRFSVPPPPPLSVLDCSLLFMLFSFVVGGSSFCPGAVLHYVPKGL